MGLFVLIIATLAIMILAIVAILLIAASSAGSEILAAFLLFLFSAYEAHLIRVGNESKSSFWSKLWKMFGPPPRK